MSRVSMAACLCVALLAGLNAGRVQADGSERSPLQGLRLFYDAEQRRSHRRGEVAARPPAVPPPAADAILPLASEPPGAHGRATVRGSGGVHRIVGGIPLPVRRR